MPAAPAATPRSPKPPSNLGCALTAIALPIVVIIGIVIGTALRNDDEEPSERRVTLEEGELDGLSWQVDAVVDIDGQTCVFLYEDGATDPLNGSCDEQPQDVTYGDQTVVFGRIAGGDTSVTVELDGEPAVDIETVAADGMEGRFYVTVVDGDTDAVSLSR